MEQQKQKSTITLTTTSKKYKLTNETIEFCGRKLHRIQALIDFSDVKVGDLGGWIEKENNLSQIGDAWVYENAKVYGNAWILHNAKVYGNANVYGNAKVYGEAKVYSNAWVFGIARVCGNAKIYGNARVGGYTKVYDNAMVGGKAIIGEFAEIHENAKVLSNVAIYVVSDIRGDSEIRSREDNDKLDRESSHRIKGNGVTNHHSTIYRAMNNSKPTRFTVLAHTFASLEDAVLYVNQIVNRGICQIIPPIKKLENGKVIGYYHCKPTSNGISYEFKKN